MSLRVSSTKLTGNPGSYGWTQVHDFKPEDREKFDLRGRLFAVISTAMAREGLEGVMAGREILTRLHEEYFGNVQKGAFNCLKDSVERVIEEFARDWGEVEIAAASLVGDVVYTAVGGGSHVLIFRKNTLATILKSEREVVSASGYPQNGDVLILATNALIKSVSWGGLRAQLERGILEDVTEFLGGHIHSSENSERKGAAFINFEEEKEVVTDQELTLQKKIEEDKHEKVLTDLRPNFFKGIFQKRPTLFLSYFSSQFRKLLKKDMYIKRQEIDLQTKGRKNLAMSVGAILLVILFVSIFFGARQAKVKQRRESYLPKLTQAQHEFSEALALFSLSPERSRELFKSSKSIVDELIDQEIVDEELLRLKGDLEGNSGLILGEYLQAPEQFLNLSLISDGFHGDKLSFSDKSFYVLDKSGRKVVKMSIDTKRTEIVAGPEQIEAADSIASYTDRVFILSERGIFEVGESTRKVTERDWQDSALVYAYTGNLYLLDIAGSKILRYQGTDSDFGPKKEWLSSDTVVDFSRSLSWAIDGNIWTLYSDGDIDKFSLGSLQAFQVSGVFPSLTSPTQIYTDEVSDFLYILDPQNERVVVLDKEGKYKAQYISSEIRDTLDLGVSEEEKKIIILTGDKLLSLEIRHLD